MKNKPKRSYIDSKIRSCPFCGGKLKEVLPSDAILDEHPDSSYWEKCAFLSENDILPREVNAELIITPRNDFPD